MHDFCYYIHLLHQLVVTLMLKRSVPKGEKAIESNFGKATFPIQSDVLATSCEAYDVSIYAPGAGLPELRPASIPQF